MKLYGSLVVVAAASRDAHTRSDLYATLAFTNFSPTHPHHEDCLDCCLLQFYPWTCFVNNLLKIVVLKADDYSIVSTVRHTVLLSPARSHQSINQDTHGPSESHARTTCYIGPRSLWVYMFKACSLVIICKCC